MASGSPNFLKNDVMAHLKTYGFTCLPTLFCVSWRRRRCFAWQAQYLGQDIYGRLRFPGKRKTFAMPAILCQVWQFVGIAFCGDRRNTFAPCGFGCGRRNTLDMLGGTFVAGRCLGRRFRTTKLEFWGFDLRFAWQAQDLVGLDCAGAGFAQKKPWRRLLDRRAHPIPTQSHRITSRENTSTHITSHHCATSHHMTTWRHSSQQHITARIAASHPIMSHNIIAQPHITHGNNTSHITTSHHITASHRTWQHRSTSQHHITSHRNIANAQACFNRIFRRKFSLTVKVLALWNFRPRLARVLLV